MLLRQSLIALSMTVQASLALFGNQSDPQASLKAAIANRRQQQESLIGWFEKNETKMGNWTLDYETPSSIQPQLQQLYGSAQTEPLAYYRNISGFFWGGFNTSFNLAPSESNLLSLKSRENSSVPTTPTLPPLNSSQLLEKHRGKYPWFSKQGGRTFFDINEEHVLPGNVSVVRGSLSLQSNSTSLEKADFDVDGLHFLSYGSLYLMGFPREPTKATDPRGLLGMIPSSLTNLTISALNKSMETRIERLHQQLLSGVEDESNESNDADSIEPLQNCTLQIYGHLTSVGNLTEIPFMDQLEHELRHPDGATFSKSIPPLQLSSIFYSPDCKILIEAPLNKGLRSDQHVQKVVRYALVLLAIQLFQSYLITRQMDRTRTPSALAKVSYLTFVFQGVLDFFTAIGHLAIGVVLQNQASKPLIAAAFISTMLCLAFLHRYVLAILNVTSAETQAPQPAPTPAPTPASDLAPAPNQRLAAGTDSQVSEGEVVERPAPEVAPAIRRELGERGRRALSFAGTIIFLFLLITYPLAILFVAAPLVYSLWIPQIVRNSKRGTRKALRHRYIIGTTLCRLFIPLYFFACPANTLFQDPNPLVWILVLYLSFQALLLMSQDFFGPNFFLPKSLRPGGYQVWEWHPLRSEIEKKRKNSDYSHSNSSSDPVDLERGTQEDSTSRFSKGFGDCAICLTPILTNEEMRRNRRAQENQKEDGGVGGSRRRRKVKNQKHKGGGSKGNWTLLQNEEEYEEEESQDSLSDNDDNERKIYDYEDEDSKEGGKSRISSHTSLLQTSSSYPQNFFESTSQYYSKLRIWIKSSRERLENQWDSNSMVGGNGKRVKEIMIAPCNHVFHSHCLKESLSYKSECPNCRASLPLV